MGQRKLRKQRIPALSRRACLGGMAGLPVLSLARPASAAIAPASNFPVLDTSAVPFIDAGGRAADEQFLAANLPRAFAIGSSGAVGWSGAASSLEEARAAALRGCAERGGRDAALYAEDSAVVWRGQRREPPPVPPPFFPRGTRNSPRITAICGSGRANRRDFTSGRMASAAGTTGDFSRNPMCGR